MLVRLSQIRRLCQRTKLTYPTTANSGPTHQNSGGKLSLGVGTTAGATDIAGQRAVLPAWRDSEGTGDCPLDRASALDDWGFQFRRSGFPIMRVHNRRTHSRTSA